MNTKQAHHAFHHPRGAQPTTSTPCTTTSKTVAPTRSWSQKTSTSTTSPGPSWTSSTKKAQDGATDSEGAIGPFATSSAFSTPLTASTWPTPPAPSAGTSSPVTASGAWTDSPRTGLSMVPPEGPSVFLPSGAGATPSLPAQMGTVAGLTTSATSPAIATPSAPVGGASSAASDAAPTAGGFPNGGGGLAGGQIAGIVVGSSALLALALLLCRRLWPKAPVRPFEDET